MHLNINGETLNITNPDKIYFPREGLTKADVIDYYIKMSRYILPHLYNRPFSMIYFPSGDPNKSFFQKQRPSEFPDYIESTKIPSSRRGHIDWCMVNNLPTLIYLAGKSIMEMHTWFSRLPHLDLCDIAAIDLDPSGNTGFSHAVSVAQAFGAVLKELNIYSVPKTSGSKGIHIFIPITPTPYPRVQEFLKSVAGTVQAAMPDLCTFTRTVANRGDRIYLDTVQCAFGKTLAMPYSLRVKPNAPVSTPLLWKEVKKDLDPSKFNIKTIEKRILKMGDLMGDFYTHAQDLPPLH